VYLLEVYQSFRMVTLLYSILQYFKMTLLSRNLYHAKTVVHGAKIFYRGQNVLNIIK